MNDRGLLMSLLKTSSIRELPVALAAFTMGGIRACMAYGHQGGTISITKKAK
jgi:hypothetical protein